MSIVKEFKDFISRGNVFDMAVGIITGAAFGKIVSSVVNDLFMPPIGILIGGTDFNKFNIVLKEAADGKDAVLFKYGAFIGITIEFLIIAFVLFLLVKLFNKLKRETEKVEPPKKSDPQVALLTEIRDLLKK